MATDFKGGFASFVDGYQKAQARTHELDRQAKSDAWVEEGQKQKRAEWERDAKAQSKADTLSRSLEGASAPIESMQEQAGPAYQDASGVATPLPEIKTSRAPTRDEQLERAAMAYSTSGDVANYVKLSDAAQAERMRSSADAFRQLNASASGLSTKDLTGRAIEIFNNDPGVGRIENPVYGDDGSVSFTAVNRKTGQKIQKQFSNPDQLLNDLHGYYSQASYADLVKQRATEKAKDAAPYDLSPGQIRFKGGLKVAENTNMTSAEARMQGLEMRIAAGLGGGSGGKAEKPIGPKISKTKTDEGTEYLDENSGAVGYDVPSSPARTGATRWFGPNDPDQPAVDRHIEWKTADGQPLPNGPQALYKQLPVNKQPAKATQNAQPVAGKSNPAPAISAATRQAQPPKPTSRAEYNQIPRGTQYQAADGTMKIKG